MRNTRARLQQLYNHDHRLTLEDAPGGGCIVKIHIPFRSSSEEVITSPCPFECCLATMKPWRANVCAACWKTNPIWRSWPSAATASRAIPLIKREKPDLVFLDIQMPEVDGFGVVSALRDEPMPLTIFVTAYDRYAMKAFEVHALDYLLKPVVKERLTEALDHARKQLLHPSEAMFQRRVLDMLADLDSRQNAPQRIVIKADGEIVCLKPGEIDWAESAGNYVCLHVGGNTHILRETITSLESRLGHRQFLRVHRSTLVNVDRIKTLRPSLYGDYAILLRDGTKLTLSRGFRENVLRRVRDGVADRRLDENTRMVVSPSGFKLFHATIAGVSVSTLLWRQREVVPSQRDSLGSAAICPVHARDR